MCGELSSQDWLRWAITPVPMGVRTNEMSTVVPTNAPISY
jgi:hypothetical protein